MQGEKLKKGEKQREKRGKVYKITPLCQECDLSPLHRKKPAHRVMCGHNSKL